MFVTKKFPKLIFWKNQKKIPSFWTSKKVLQHLIFGKNVPTVVAESFAKTKISLLRATVMNPLDEKLLNSTTVH